MLDVPQSRAFAVADHQIAHLYVAEPGLIGEVRRIVGALPGVEHVLDRDGQRAVGLDHAHSGELVALAEPDAWFTYYYWLDDNLRRISRAWSRSTASPATTRSSCSSIRRSARPSSRSAGASRAARSDSAP